MTKDDDRFGIPDSVFEAAREAHGRQSLVYRCGMYVPTRKEVLETPPDDLWYIIINWMWESPSELIPNNEQISAVREILFTRADVDSERISSLIDECDAYLKI